MSTEDDLRGRLRAEFGDPTAVPGGADPTVAEGWASIEAGSARRARRTHVLAGAGAALAVALAITGVAVLTGHRTTDSSLTNAAGPSGQETTVVSALGSTDATATLEPSSTVTGLEPPPTAATIPSTVTTGASGPPPPVVTTTSTTTPAGQVDCGIRYLASGWPTTTMPYPGFADCIEQAFATGRSAIYVERAQTDGSGGHIEITTYEVVGVRLVRREVDSRGAQPPGVVTLTTCTGLTHSSFVVVPAGCHS